MCYPLSKKKLLLYLVNGFDNISLKLKTKCINHVKLQFFQFFAHVEGMMQFFLSRIFVHLRSLRRIVHV